MCLQILRVLHESESVCLAIGLVARKPQIRKVFGLVLQAASRSVEQSLHEFISKIIARYKLPTHLDCDIAEELVLSGFLSPRDPVFPLCGSIFACMHFKIFIGSSLHSFNLKFIY